MRTQLRIFHNEGYANLYCRPPLERSPLSSLKMSLSPAMRALAERIRPSEAVTTRQVFRLLKAYHGGGSAALISKKRGKPSNRAYPAVVQTEAMALIKANSVTSGRRWRPRCLWSGMGCILEGRAHGIAESDASIGQIAVHPRAERDYDHPRPPASHPCDQAQGPCAALPDVRQVDQAAIVENKRLGPVLTYIAQQQKLLDTSRSQKAPRRRGQGPSLFKAG